MKRHQFELPTAGMGGVFNLAGETGKDPFRLERERWEREESAKRAAEYQERMQRTLLECPGFVGADPPVSDDGKGKVMVHPGLICEAMEWLKRRFHVSENLSLSTDTGLCIELAPRPARKRGAPVRRRVSFDKPQQYELKL